MQEQKTHPPLALTRIRGPHPSVCVSRFPLPALLALALVPGPRKSLTRPGTLGPRILFLVGLRLESVPRCWVATCRLGLGGPPTRSPPRQTTTGRRHMRIVDRSLGSDRRDGQVPDRAARTVCVCCVLWMHNTTQSHPIHPIPCPCPYRVPGPALEQASEKRLSPETAPTCRA